jgi:hypothetical protein
MSVSLIVETGSLIANANSYVDVTYADTYFAQRAAPLTGPNQKWCDGTGGNVDLKSAALIKATQFLEYYWHQLYKGQRLTYTQALSWPRVGATLEAGDASSSYYWKGQPFLIPIDQIPDILKQAECELASRSLILGAFSYPEDLAPDITPENSAVISEKVGPIEVTYDKSLRQVVTIYRIAEMLLQPILRSSSGQIALERG